MSKSHIAFVSTVSALALSAALSSPAAAQSPIAAWSGPYFGLDAGTAWSNAKNVRSASDVNWGAYAGYGLQFGLLYVGGELDATRGGSSSTTDILGPLLTSTLDVDWTASARARVGLAFGDALVYATGGAAWSGQTTTIKLLGAPLAQESAVVTGAVWGAGFEFKPLPYLSARVEALRYDFSTDAEHMLKSLPAGVANGSLKGLVGDETVVRAGLSLRFN